MYTSHMELHPLAPRVKSIAAYRDITSFSYCARIGRKQAANASLRSWTTLPAEIDFGLSKMKKIT
jgi:hypothetical protein